MCVCAHGFRTGLSIFSFRRGAAPGSGDAAGAGDVDVDAGAGDDAPLPRFPPRPLLLCDCDCDCCCGCGDVLGLVAGVGCVAGVSQCTAVTVISSTFTTRFSGAGFTGSFASTTT